MSAVSLSGGTMAAPAMRALEEECALTVRGLCHSYDGQGTQRIRVLEDVDLAVKQNEFHALLGPSGCGKSTLLYLIGGFIPIQRGDVHTRHGRVVKPGLDRGVVFQNFALFPWKTVRQNVLYGLEKQKIDRAEREDRAQHFIDLVHLSGFEARFPAELSGGMQQRAAIARTLAADPEMLLMDEPFGALDAQTRFSMQEELRRIWQDSASKTVIFVTHDVQEAVFLADRISVMSTQPGRIAHQVVVDFSREGGLEAMKRPAFMNMVDHVWKLVMEEAAKGRSPRP